jgi:NADPH2:quinone reductase
MASGSPTEVSTRNLMRGGLTVTWALRARSNQRELETRALAEAAAGRLVPALTRFPLAEAAAAHAAIEARKTEGKVVLVPTRR